MNSDVRALINTVKTMDEQIKLCLEMTKKEIENAGFNFDIADDLYRFKKEQIEAFDSGVIANIYRKYDITMKMASDTEYDEFIEETRRKILSIYDSVCQFQDLLKERNTLVDDVQKIMNDYTDYLNSDEMKEKELQQINDLKAQIDNENDSIKKKKLEEKLYIIESTETLDFIFERMNKLKDKEIINIMHAFFDQEKSNYILRKFKNKMEQIDMNGEQYKTLLDIEVNFLDPIYRPLNNIFLFNLIRFVAYSDMTSPKESVYAQTLLIRTLKLVYHKYQNKEDELHMIDMIRKLDDHFMYYVNTFIEKNTTSPDSEFRVNLKKKRDEETLKNIAKWFEEKGEEVPEGTIEDLSIIIRNRMEKEKIQDWFTMYGISYDENATLEELTKMRDNMNKPDETEIEEIDVPDEDVAISGYISEPIENVSKNVVVSETYLKENLERAEAGLPCTPYGIEEPVGVIPENHISNIITTKSDSSVINKKIVNVNGSTIIFPNEKE